MSNITFLRGLTEQELLTMRSAVVTAMVTGGSVGSAISSVSTRDLSVTYATGGYTPEQVLSAIRYALQLIDSDVYGTDLIHRKTKWVR